MGVVDMTAIFTHWRVGLEDLCASEPEPIWQACKWAKLIVFKKPWLIQQLLNSAWRKSKGDWEQISVKWMQALEEGSVTF